MARYDTMTDAEILADQREYYLTAPGLTDAERRDALAWVAAGCPGDTHGTSGDVGYEDGDFA